MADAPQMERPGVKVITEFRGTTPTILRPSLQACIVGPCKQVVEAVTDEGTLNSEAIVSIPARLTTPFVEAGEGYADLEGVSLFLSVNNNPGYEVKLPASQSDITPAKVVDAVLTAKIPGLTAYVETSGDDQRAVLESTSRGDNAVLTIANGTAAEILLAFGWPIGFSVQGATGYDNTLNLDIQPSDYPDPRGNRADLKIDPDSVRVFISPGSGSPIEVSRNEALLAGATAAVTVIDDGDGDNASPYLEFAGANFASNPTPAVLTGTAAPSDFAAQVRGKVLRMSLDGEPYQSLTFSDATASINDIVTAINDLWGDDVASVSGGFLRITSPSQYGGRESSIRVDKQASTPVLLTALGLTGNGNPLQSVTAVYGGAYKPAVGDEVWVDGIKLGAVVEVPASPTNRLRLASEQLLTFQGTSYRIVAKNLSNDPASATRPSSALLVDPNTGTISVKAGLFQTTTGAPVAAKGLPVYLAYDALRLDVTPKKKAGDFNLLRIGSLTNLETQLAPVDTQNPLALGMYYALLNAPGLEVTGCGIDEANDGAPEGTADAYARSFEYLESKEVYAIVPLTHSADVGSIADAHVTELSKPDNGLERIALLNPMRPTRRSATLIASGARANVVGPPVDVVETGLANLPALLAAAGKAGPTYTEADAIYLMFEGDSNHYLVQEVSGGAITVNNGPLTNTDGFFFDGEGQPVFEDIVVDRPFTVAVRGAAIANRTDEAVAYADLGRGYRNSRVIVVAPDTAKTTLDGLESAVPGYYAAAGLAGRKSSKGPSQPMTEDELAGFTGVIGTQDRYSEPQLRIMAGGGIWILYQEADGQPVRTRHQLTTDVSTLMARESSITDALDYAAKTLRQTFKNFIGRFNITTGLIEALNLVCDGVRDFLTIHNQIFSEFNVVGLEQDADNPDELSVIADVATFKPFNRLRITMRVT